MCKRIGAAALLLLAIVFPTAFSQTTNATLGGSVSDTSRALIPGVTVTATNTLTVSGLTSGESNYYDIDFMTASGTSHNLFQSPFFTSVSSYL